MILVRISNEKQNQQFEQIGLLEFGRGPQREVPRCQLDDIFVSRDHLRLEELADGRVQLQNLSTTRPVFFPTGDNLPVGTTTTAALPVQFQLGKTQINLDPPPDRQLAQQAILSPIEATAVPVDTQKIPATKAADQVAEDQEPFHQDTFQLLAGEAMQIRQTKKGRPQLAAQLGGDNAVRDTLALWLDTVIDLQRASPGSPEFYRQTAKALAELVDLDLGLVLLKRKEKWAVAGAYTADDNVSVHYSRTLLDHVATTRTTVYQDINNWKANALSLANIEAVVASPIFGTGEEVAGILYGMRVKGVVERGGIQPLEAQLVQLLAGAVGSHLGRSAAQRTRIQFEQFFSPELVRELERNPNLLEGRTQDVTVLFSDLRGFTVLSQRLGPEKTCRLVRDVMERLSERIVEHGGIIVDYAGDGILAMWNAPTPQADHALRACHAALDMLGEMAGLNEKWHEAAEGTLAVGIGINTGSAQVGNTGSSRKMKYGPHGHTVNVASRVQDATKKLGLPLLITAATRELLPSGLAARRLGRVRLPGVQEPVVLHELHGRNAPTEWAVSRDTYETALSEYEAGQWAKACQTLLPLLQQFEKADHHDGPTLKLLRRAGECLEAGPDPFDPIIEVTTK